MIPNPAEPLHRGGRQILAAQVTAIIIAGLLAANRLAIANLCDVPEAEGPSPKISAAASARCVRKVETLQAFAAATGERKKQTIRLTEEEFNSYLALELKSKYHPCLRGLEVRFEENKLKGVASIDFEKLSLNSTKIVARMLARLLTGVHALSVDGKLEAAEGKAKFVLDEARFDTIVLPDFLVEEIISAVGRKQKPPFDPMQPSQMPYKIEKVEVHKGQITIYQ